MNLVSVRTFAIAIVLGCLFALPMMSRVARAEQCDASLWSHVYHGRYARAQDRLRVIKPCVTITGMIVNATPEADGDFHIRVDVDDKSLLNSRNLSGQHGYLVVEPVCENPVTQVDTGEEGVCDGFAQRAFTKNMNHHRASITGAYVQDMEHGWNEIHPVTSIRIIPGN
jgi:hypothetical protein